MKFYSLGILLIALGGFEKIMIFVSLADTVHQDYQALKNFTPSVIWSIPNYTIFAGVLLVLINLILYTRKTLLKK